MPLRADDKRTGTGREPRGAPGPCVRRGPPLPGSPRARAGPEAGGGAGGTRGPLSLKCTAAAQRASPHWCRGGECLGRCSGPESPSADERELRSGGGVRKRRTHFTAPSLFSSFLPLESSPFFFFEDTPLPLPGLPVPTGGGGDPEWRWAVGHGAFLAVPEPSGGT